MKRLVAITLLLVLLTGCAAIPEPVETKQFNATFLELFDTVTTVVGKAESEEAFQSVAWQVRDKLKVYHQLFDIYNDYDGINNLKTVNDNAGVAPVKVDPAVIRLLQDCREYYAATNGKVNVAMGAVLHLWHQARNDGLSDPVNAALPKEEALREAAKHCNIDDVILDEDASTVYLRDPAMRLDVGAVAKGWAAQQVAEDSPKGLLISVGGNVCATDAKDEYGTPWVIGIENPDGGNYLHTLNITRNNVVTSGDYQRVYVVEGKAYHHIIDPVTLYPATHWRSVSVVCPDSGAADALSTALFLLDREAGEQLLKQYDACAMWVDSQGGKFYSPGFEELIRT